MKFKYRVEPPARLRGSLPIRSHRTVESCAFFIAAASVRLDNHIHIPAVELQSVGYVFLKYAILMGTRIEIQNHRWEAGVSIGNLDIHSSKRLSDARVLEKDRALLAGASSALEWMRCCVNPSIQMPETLSTEQAVMDCVISKKIKTISGALSDFFIEDCEALNILIKNVSSMKF